MNDKIANIYKLIKERYKPNSIAFEESYIYVNTSEFSEGRDYDFSRELLEMFDVDYKVVITHGLPKNTETNISGNGKQTVLPEEQIEILKNSWFN